MPIVGQDQRRVVDRFDVPGQIIKEPLPSITAIDTRYQDETRSTGPGIGTGVVISPNYVLTAAHNLFVKEDIGAYYTDIRVTSSNQQKDLDGRSLGAINRLDTGNVDLQVDSNVNPLDDPINTVPPGLFLPFVEQFLLSDPNTREESHVDIGLIEVNDRALISDAPPIGLIAFVDPLTLEESSFNFRIQTAGYPADNVANSFPTDNPNNEGIPDRNDNDNSSIRPVTELDGLVNSLQVRGRDLVLAPGTLDANGNETTGRIERASEIPQERRIQYSSNIDTVAGQSGSPVWGFLPEEYELEPIPRVFAVHSRGISAGINAANYGTLIDKEAYDLIINKINGDGDPNLLPENAIIGSNPRNEFTNPPNDGNDLIEGTYRRELILGLTGNDTIFGAGADDRLEGNEGNDELDGGTGKDIITGGPGNDLIDGGTDLLAIINPFDRENDIAVFSAPISEYNIEIDTSGGLFGSPIGGEAVTTITHLNGGIDGQDTLTNIEILVFSDGAVPLSSDDDIIDDLLNFFGGSEDDNIVGNILDNQLRGEAGNDTLDGKAGDDDLDGGIGDDTLIGGMGNDTLKGSANRDYLTGDEDNDVLIGGAGNDTLFGSTGKDNLNGNNNNDVLYGGAGNDTLRGNFGRDYLRGDEENDVLIGGADNDTLRGDSGRDYLRGDEEDDVLIGGASNDTLFGGTGKDNLNGNNSNDVLYGGAGNDTLRGNFGRDYLKGDEGNDVLIGGASNDTLFGGTGRDFFSLQNIPSGVDEIRDFELNGDKIGLGSISYDAIALRGDSNTTLSYNGRDFAVLLGIDSNSLNSTHFS